MKPASGRVLIADDEPHVRELLRDFLAAQGYEATTVATGAEALAAVPTLQPDAILVDMLMPGLCGSDVLDALHRADITVPVILISGHQVAVREGFFVSFTTPASPIPSTRAGRRGSKQTPSTACGRRLAARHTRGESKRTSCLHQIERGRTVLLGFSAALFDVALANL
jgi:CheY-like chemotaxis protein